MKMASPFSYCMPDRTAVMGRFYENGSAVFILLFLCHPGNHVDFFSSWCVAYLFDPEAHLFYCLTPFQRARPIFSCITGMDGSYGVLFRLFHTWYQRNWQERENPDCADLLHNPSLPPILPSLQGLRIFSVLSACTDPDTPTRTGKKGRSYERVHHLMTRKDILSQ
jgi:hypothetical protein